MTHKVFIDTNILVYSMDVHDGKKRNACRALLKKTAIDGNGVISTQVMQEFYVAATVKLKADPLKVKAILHSFENLEIISITPPLIKEAVDCQIINRISFWDSLIVIAAEYSKCAELWTEDLNEGQTIRGVKIVNPIKQRLKGDSPQ
jgi:predicted nucleic acid-binding protein